MRNLLFVFETIILAFYLIALVATLTGYVTHESILYPLRSDLLLLLIYLAAQGRPASPDN